MASKWGHRIRPFLYLVSFILFLVLLRTHLYGKDPSSGPIRAINRRIHLRSSHDWKSDTSCPHASEQGSQGAFRRILGLESIKAAVKNGTLLPTETLANPILDNGTTLFEGGEEIFTPCQNVRAHLGFPDSCSYVRANPQCRSGTLIEYTDFFYCKCAHSPSIAYFVLFLWLMALFYMLGNTAADFFCSSLEKLSNLLLLPPTVAGVSLLPLGNGAPDVFASIAAFMGSEHGQVGLNSVLGGAVFVTSVVAGSVCLVVSSAPGTGMIHLDRSCFFRDIGFFLVSLGVLCIILIVGKVHFWGAVAFSSIYVVYAITVAAGEWVKTHKKRQSSYALEPLLESYSPLRSSYLSDEEQLGPFSESIDAGPSTETNLPQWMWASHVAIYSHKGLAPLETSYRPLWGWSEQQEAELQAGRSLQRLLCRTLEILLTLPRRLTIPIVEDSRWSRPFAIASAALSPTLLAAVWDSNEGHPLGGSVRVYMFGGSVGALLSILAFVTTTSEHPPRQYLFPWVVGGFIMSVVWFYLVANELVAALVSLGVMLDIDAAILGLTVLAWGNSIGDLVSNLALASNGSDGVQIAMSGCYAGPMFNTLVGLGLSLLLASWKTYPLAFVVPTDNTLFYTLGFLFVILLWALVVLPARRMAPSKGLGIGLLFLYASFLALRLANILGLISMAGLPSALAFRIMEFGSQREMKMDRQIKVV